MTTVTLPPGPSTPRVVQGAYGLIFPHRGMRRLRDRYGDAFTIYIPVVGRAVVVSDAAQIKQLFTAGPDDVDNLETNLGRFLGPGSLFALTGAEHHRQRKLLIPPFHGRRLSVYERIVEEETVREMASWPQDRELPVLASTTRITLNVILRAVFGAEGAEFAELRDLLPRWIALSARLVLLPIPELGSRRWSPWGRFRAIRREYDAIVGRLIDKAVSDGLDGRDDVLAMMLSSRYDDGSAMSRAVIGDQLLTLLTAGHETTATTLAWAVERIRRHPAVLRDLVEEVDAGGTALREATILEVQRTRPVVEFVGRQVTAERYQLGPWTLPRGIVVFANIDLLHGDETVFPNPRAFDPSRFLGARPDLYTWIPFGGGTRRCLGAAFANMEMHVVLRTLLRDYTLMPTGERGERWHLRGVTNAPGKGGRAVLCRRRRPRSATPASTAASTPATVPATGARP